MLSAGQRASRSATEDLNMKCEREMKTGFVDRYSDGGELGKGPGCPWAGTSPQLIPGEVASPFPNPTTHGNSLLLSLSPNSAPVMFISTYFSQPDETPMTIITTIC